MEELQKLIDLLKIEKEKARIDFLNHKVGSKEETYGFAKHHAFSFILNEAEKLLKKWHESNNLTLAIAQTPCKVKFDFHYKLHHEVKMGKSMGRAPADRQNLGSGIFVIRFCERAAKI